MASRVLLSIIVLGEFSRKLKFCQERGEIQVEEGKAGLIGHFFLAFSLLDHLDVFDGLFKIFGAEGIQILHVSFQIDLKVHVCFTLE